MAQLIEEHTPLDAKIAQLISSFALAPPPVVNKRNATLEAFGIIVTPINKSSAPLFPASSTVRKRGRPPKVKPGPKPAPSPEPHVPSVESPSVSKTKRNYEWGRDGSTENAILKAALEDWEKQGRPGGAGKVSVRKAHNIPRHIWNKRTVTEFTYFNDWKTEINNVPNNNEDIKTRHQRILSSLRFLGCLLGDCLPE